MASTQDIWDNGGYYDEHSHWVDAQDVFLPDYDRDPYAEALRELERGDAS